MASTTGSTSLPTGCFKCGRPGHWSRDCPANPSEATAGGAGQGAAGSKFSATGGFNRGNSLKENAGQARSDWKTTRSGSQNNKGVPKETIPKEPRKRPKLTADLLLSEDGLGYVLEKMPRMVSIKGRKQPPLMAMQDTVVRDLRRLLEGYLHWHSLLLPYFSFDQFVEKVEKLGGSKRVRSNAAQSRKMLLSMMCTRELREKIIYGKGNEGEKEVEGEAVGGSASKDTPPKDTSVCAEGEIDHISPDDVFVENEPADPVNDEDFEDFFKQGVDEPANTRPTSTDGGGNAPGIQIDASPVTQCPSSAGVGGTVPRPPATSGTISEAAAVRMEANRLQALERARARRARTLQV